MLSRLLSSVPDPDPHGSVFKKASQIRNQFFFNIPIKEQPSRDSALGGLCTSLDAACVNEKIFMIISHIPTDFTIG